MHLGRADGPDVQRNYDRVIAEWLAGSAPLDGDDLTVVELAAAFLKHAQAYYRKPDGTTGDALKAWRKDHRWHPHQLRHNATTNLKREHGIETARVILGHKSPLMTEHYAELERTKPVVVIGRVG